MRHTDPSAAYAACTAQIHAKLARLKHLAEDHFGRDPDAIHWDHLGDMGRTVQDLDELLAICIGQPK